MRLEDLETPCLVLDKNRLNANINNMALHVKTLGSQLRPHGKTAKNFDVLQLALGDNCPGITVSTLKEADYFFEKGIKDIIYAVGICPVKLKHCAELIKKGAELTLILDNLEQAEALASKGKELGVVFRALIEIDCDGHRSGVSPTNKLLTEIGSYLNDHTHTELRGILTHAGDSYNCSSTNHIRQLAEKERLSATECADKLKAANLPCPVVSIGSTPTVKFADNLDGITEVRCGVYMFYDLVMAGLGVCRIDDIALSVLTSVIGHQKWKNWVITDSGWTSLSCDRGTASHKKDQQYGVVCDLYGRAYKDILVAATNQEHGIVAQRDEENFDRRGFELGDKLRILPNHACATATMHDRYYVVDNSSEVIDVWDRINGW